MLDIKVLRETSSVRLLREILAGERSTRNSSKASLNCFSMGHSEKLKASGGEMYVCVCVCETELVDRISFRMECTQPLARSRTRDA